MKRLKTWIRNLVSAGLGVVLALLMFELLLAVFWPQERQTPLFDSTPVFPLVLRKNVDSEHISPEFHVHYRTNGYRLRDPERPLEKPPGVFRILVLGDSLTFGSGVNDEDTYVRQLERMLNARNDGRRYEVINAACASWGTAHHMMFLDHLGFRFQPDLLLMAFHDDDPNDNRASGFFSVTEDDRLHHEKPEPHALKAAKKLTAMVPFYEFLCRHSHLFSILRLRLAEYIKNLRAPPPDKDKGAREDEKKKKDENPYVWPEESWKLTRLLFHHMAERAEEEGARLAVMHAPFVKYNRPEPFNRAVEQRFLDMAKACGAPALKLIGRLESQGAKEQYMEDPIYFPVNLHFTPRGNRVIAEALLKFLDQHHLLDPARKP